jgi:hypothetical protein
MLEPVLPADPDGDFDPDATGLDLLEIVYGRADTLYRAVAGQDSARSLGVAVATLDRDDLELLITMAVIGSRAASPDFDEWLGRPDSKPPAVQIEPDAEPSDWDDLFASTTDTVTSLAQTRSSRSMRAAVKEISSPWLRIVVAASVGSERAEQADFEDWIAGFGDVVRPWLDEADFAS